MLDVYKRQKETYTIGKLSIDGENFCDTIEDKDRGLSQDMPEHKIKEFTTLMAEYQTAGKGQRGNSWESEPIYTLSKTEIFNSS